MKRLISSLATLILCTTSYSQDLEPGGLDLQLTPTMPDSVHINSNQGAEFNSKTGLIRYLGGIQINTDNGLQIFANQALVDTKKEVILLNGDVSIYQNSILHRGEKASYNYGNEQLDTSNLSSSLDPILLDSNSFRTKDLDNQRVYIGKNAKLTTHDREKPNFWIKANEIKIYPEENVVFRNLKLYAGDTPIFWLPYLSQSLDSELGYHFTPGAKSSWGAFLLNTYGIMLGGDENPETGRKENQWLLSEWQFDIRSKRGIGTGLSLSDTRLEDNSNLGWAKLYYAKDQDPSLSRNGASRGNTGNDRYKLELKNRIEWQSTPSSQIIVDANVTYLNDRYYLQDFETSTFEVNPQPDNIVDIKKRNDTFQFGVFARFQPNNFYQVDQRLPEIYLDYAKRPIFGTKLLHEGTSSLGYYKEKAGSRNDILTRNSNKESASSLNQLREALSSKQFGRLHTYQEFSYPIVITNGATITPRVGGGYSQYWGSGRNNRDHSSPHGYLGLDAAMKFSKNFSNVRSDRWGLNELLHIVQPYANFSILSTNELDDTQGRIDRLTPTERPRTFDVARYSAIDDYRNWSIIRLGARNQLLTKRDSRSHSWLSLDSYIDSFLNDPEGNRDFSNFYNDLKWEPVPWARLNLNTQFPINSGGFTEVSTSITFWPHENLELELGHGYLGNHPEIVDSNLIRARTYFRINHKWGIGTYHQWQLDDNTLERQEYSFNRNLQSWTAGFGFFQRNNRIQKEYGALFSISLNALPNLNLPLSLEAQ